MGSKRGPAAAHRPTSGQSGAALSATIKSAPTWAAVAARALRSRGPRRLPGLSGAGGLPQRPSSQVAARPERESGERRGVLARLRCVSQKPDRIVPWQFSRGHSVDPAVTADLSDQRAPHGRPLIAAG
jgi:hypothetical protein